MALTGTIPSIVALYKIDRDIHTLTLALDNVQRDQRRQQAKIDDLTKTVEAQDLSNKKIQADQNIREMDLKTRQEHIEKLRESLNSAKTNKDYSAVLVHISAEKAEVSKIEVGVLELMQQVESNNKTIAANRAQIEEEIKLLQKIESEHGAKVATLQSQIDALTKQRAHAASVVPTEPLRQYDRTSQKYPGDALAPLEFDEGDLDSVSCGSCYMGLSAENLNALRGRDEIRKCNSCHRILYLPEMLPAEPSAAR